MKPPGRDMVGGWPRTEFLFFLLVPGVPPPVTHPRPNRDPPVTHPPVFSREQKHVGVGYGAPNLMGEGLPEAKFRAGARENDESLSERP